VPRLRDIIAPDLRALFVGINPGLRSAALGHNFAGRGNPFWRLLHASALIPEPLDFTRERELLRWGFGITNIGSRPTRSAAELDRDELRAGAAALTRKVTRLRPRVAVFVGLTIYQLVFPRGEKGAGQKPERIAGARVFVVPNPSGLNASFPGFDHKLKWFVALREFLDELAPAARAGSTRRPA
jgi:TDG/mug DNA glycosylase family protein